MTSEKSTYKNLNLDREKLSEFIKQFYQENGLKELERTPSEWGPDDKLRVIRFGRPGSNPAQVNLYLNQDGSTSILYKTGKNYDLGECLAVYLKETINPDEFERVEMSLNSIPAGDFAVLLDCLKEEGYEMAESVVPGGEKIDIRSLLYKDKLSLCYFPKSFTLRIQGRPLSCYRAVVYHLTELLDLAGLEKVLVRREEGRAQIVRKNLAEDYLASKLGATYDKLSPTEQDYLISAWMIKLSSPDLPDYSFLLLPELRVLEGAIKVVLKQAFSIHMKKTETFGAFFPKDNSTRAYYFKPPCAQKVSEEHKDALESAYNFYYRERHGYSHSTDEPALNPVISSFSVLQEKSEICLTRIKALYDLL